MLLVLLVGFDTIQVPFLFTKPRMQHHHVLFSLEHHKGGKHVHKSKSGEIEFDVASQSKEKQKCLCAFTQSRSPSQHVFFQW